MSEKVPIIVVFGIDIDGRTHASRFEEHHAALAQRAAEMMGFHLLRIAPDNDQLHGIAEGLPPGKIFASGRAFVPFAGRLIVDRLAAAVEGGGAAKLRIGKAAASAYPVAASFAAEAVKSADMLWSNIEVGTVVLAAQPDLYGPGWWEGVVVGVDGDDLTLRWLDGPELEPFHVARREIALRHPGAD